MAYHSSQPQKALKYKKRLTSAYEMVKQAHNIDADRKLFGNIEQPQHKKLETKVAYAKKNNSLKKQASAAKANAWREAKLAEYRKSKLK